MGLDEENGKFYGVDVQVIRASDDERFSAIMIPGVGIVIGVGPMVLLQSKAQIEEINNRSRSDYAGNPVPGRQGIIERIAALDFYARD